MHITHLGHACLLVEIDMDSGSRSRLLIDPGNFSDFDSVERLDAILITHQHPDHCDPEKVQDLIARNPAAIVRADPQTTQLLRGHGLDVVEHRAGSAYDIRGVTVTPVGNQHAVIHPYIDRIDNLGVVLSADGEPTLFHPGDALDADPGRDVDILAVPVNAPWCAVKETIEFVRRLEPKCVVPIHDALLKPFARTMYLNHIGGYGLDGGVQVRDLAGEGSVVFAK